MQHARIILDVPSHQPALDFNRYADALKEIIEVSDPRFAIGILGGWGSGKTTLMQAIESRLNSVAILTVKFSAWRYEKEEHLIVPLLDTLREALVEWAARNPKAADKAVATASLVSKVAYALIAGFGLKIGIPEIVEVSYEANKSLAAAQQLSQAAQEASTPRSFYHASFRALSNAFSDFLREVPARRIVVFVDDLDRCLPEKALEVLESMKLFFDLEGFIFVVGLDQAVVQAAIELRYARRPVALSESERAGFRINGTEYVKKIFQVPFTLFPVSTTEIDNFLYTIFEESKLPEAQKQDLRNVVRPHLDFLVLQGGINPREIKRYINAYTLLCKIKPWLQAEVILALQTITFRPDWELVRESLYAYRQEFVHALHRQIIEDDSNALEALDPRLRAIPADFLAYVALGSPAHALLVVNSIEEYIYAGEATTITAAVRVSDLVRAIAELRAVLSRVAEAGDASAQTQAVEAARSHMLRVRNQLDTPDAPHPLAFSARRQLYELERHLGNPGKPDAEQWLQANNNLITQMITSLTQWSR